MLFQIFSTITMQSKLLRKYLLTGIVFCLFFCVSSSIWATTQYFGVKLEDNDYEEQLQIESGLATKFQMISLIYDNYDRYTAAHIAKLVQNLGTGRIYAITISPFGYSAQQVADGQYDTQYREFFSQIQKHKIELYNAIAENEKQCCCINDNYDDCKNFHRFDYMYLKIVVIIL